VTGSTVPLAGFHNKAVPPTGFAGPLPPSNSPAAAAAAAAVPLTSAARLLLRLLEVLC